MEDCEIIELLLNRKEAGLKEIAEKYARLYKSILREALADECDIEECANDCLLAVWNSIPPNRPTHLQSYVCRIARRIGINRYKHNTREKRGSGYTVLLSELEDALPDHAVTELDGDESAAFERILSDCIREMEAETRVLFVRRYLYFESPTSLAQRFGLKENTVSAKLYRARKKLKKHLEQEGYFL